jgi:hypothetical protein
MSTLSTASAAKKAGITRVTLARWLAAGRIRPSIAIPMRGQTLWRWTAEDVARVKKLVGLSRPGPKPRTKVVHVKVARYDVYIGRANPRNHLPASIWRNPFKGPHAIERYRKWLMAPAQAWLRKRLPELRGKILGCWCRPLECHGDVLAKVADRKRKR